MNYKMIAIDMDDTLLNDDLEISKENKEAIKKALEKDVKLVLCSGRSSISLDPYLKELNLKEENQYGISYNGAIIFKTKTLEIVNQENVSIEYARYLFSFAKENNIHVQTYQDEDLIVEKANYYTERYSKLTSTVPVEVGDLLKWIQDDVIKVLFQDEHKRLVEIEEKLKSWAQGRVHMFFSKPFYLEFTSINANKGIAVIKLGEKLGLKREEIISIGDSFNDLYMIKEAGLGIAMKNGHPEVKKRADYVTENSNNHHAIKEVIEKFIL